jgi:aryl-phospho-beta-D-glucosidase BglC (GH1 family)
MHLRCLLPLLLIPGLIIAATAPSAVSATRLERLSRGVNLSHWFSQMPLGEESSLHQRFKTYDQPADFTLLASAGFRHVRFPVEFELFLDEKNPGRLRPEFLADFDTALDQLLGAGLAVIVDWHAREDTKNRLQSDDLFVTQTVALWDAMARHLANRDPERVFLELMNEPAGNMSLARWSSIQDQFLKVVRAGAPQHTIIVTSHRWSGLDELVQLRPLADPNLVYNFHFYEPMVFTHQAAPWPDMGLEPITGLAYPADQNTKEANLQRIGSGKGRVHLLDYTADRAWIAARLALAVSWGKKYSVPVTCNEFGVYTKVTPAPDRYRWLRDVREICESHGIGWSIWDYAGGFRVVAKDEPGQRTLDPACLQALGLK